MNRLTSKLIWLYFILIVVEGPLRKWFLIGLSDAFLIIRDPLVVGIYVLAIQEQRFPFNRQVISAGLIGFLAVLICGVLQGVPVLVQYFGFRSLFLHIPLIFIIPQYLNRDDIIRHGKWLLVLLIPQALLMALQFGVSPTHVLNASPGGSLGSQMEGAMGRIRPPGFFSFITGAAQFLGLAAVYVIHGLVATKYYVRWLVYAAGAALVVALIVSISRLAIGSVLIVGLMLIPISLVLPSKQLRIFTRLIVPLAIIGFGVAQLEVFDAGHEALTSRLERTGDLQAGFTGTAFNWTDRFINDLTSGLYSLGQVKLFGAGLGMGTNVGARYVQGRLGFTLAEGEWGRIVGELGPIIGGLTILLRLGLVVFMAKRAFTAIRQGNLLPILLFGACALLVMSGQWGQSTTAGFAIWIAGATLAAIRIPAAGPSAQG
jgi:hypothetical protein